MKATSVKSDSSLGRPVRYLHGIGPKRSELLQKLGVQTVRDMLYFFPRRYEDRSRFVPIHEIRIGDFVTVKGEVLTLGLKRVKRMTLLEVAIGDSTGVLYAVWFNQPYMKKNFKVGDPVIVSGKADFYNRLQLNSPEYEILESSEEDTIHTGRIVPIYPLTEGINQRGLRRTLKRLLESEGQEIREFLPGTIARKMSLMGLPDAIREIHFPDDFHRLEEARRRLIFDEFFLFELILLWKLNRDRTQLRTQAFSGGETLLQEFRKTLHFQLTASQEQVIQEILKDLEREQPMRRLLQGDVGSGKTVVASFCLLLAAKNRLQSALMVPTEILAEQHHATLERLLKSFSLKVVLLTGGLAPEKRRSVLRMIQTQQVDVVVGTHALIQEGVRFSKLGLLVIDEQHKFGVRQRGVLLNSKSRPHLLVMTATPIPRTLGLTLYGDLDISTLKELPQGRQPIRSFWISKEKEREVFEFVHSQVKSGEQAFIIFPIIEETEKLDLQAAKQEYEVLKRGIFSDAGVELLHGRMSKEEKDRVMSRFNSHKAQVLVTTSLVEVGIDNPEANLMVIEHAERFGLSQLHQIRGRIGRGGRESFCFLFGNPTTEEGKRRLRILTKTTDGFRISEEDLRLRGPGDFLGTRQSGLPTLRLGDLVRDEALLNLARREAIALIQGEGQSLFHRYEELKKRLEAERAELEAVR